MIKITIESTVKKDNLKEVMRFTVDELKERRGVPKSIQNKIVPVLFKILRSVRDK